MTAPRKFDSFADLILHGELGDFHHDLPKDKERSVTTYVLRDKKLVTDPKSAHTVGSTAALFYELRTQHHGKSELYGRMSYCYTTIDGEHEAATEPDSIFVRHLFSMSNTDHRVLTRKEEAKRYGRKKLLEIHAEELAANGYPAL